MKEGNVYCSVCGAEAMVVPDYSVLEDDYLRTLIAEDAADEKDMAETQDTTASPAKKTKKISSMLPIVVVCILLVIGILGGVAAKLVIDRRNANSYDYQVQQAKQEYQNGNEENALRYYQAALALRPEDIAVRLAMADIYLEQKVYDSALVLLVEIIRLDDSHREAYGKLIGIYDERGDYESILALKTETTAASLADLFVPYEVTEPVISPIAGTYEDEINVVIVSLDGYEIYYTTDGTPPDTSTGTLYQREILLDEPGTYEIQAVCANDKGILSEIVDAVYHIEYLPPKFPAVSPDGGRIMEETFVTIVAEPGCSIYYTWDSTDPTRWSPRYESPLLVPVGNTVLSILVINDKTGLDSGIYRTNFIYFPES